MKCENCGQNEASIHMVRIDNGAAREYLLCNSCAAQYGMATGSYSLKDILSTFMQVQQPSPRACSNCGSTLADIKRTGFVGCEQCYTDLRQELLPMIQAIHGSTAHVGGGAGRLGSSNTAGEVDALKSRLLAAIEQEHYEEAAQLRDRIRSLQSVDATQHTDTARGSNNGGM